MATRTQAKAAIDAAVVDIKAEFDTILFAGVNIVDGSIAFAPTRWSVRLDAGGSSTTAETWLTNITTNLTTASRAYSVRRGGRRSDDGVAGKIIEITSGNSRYVISNF